MWIQLKHSWVHGTAPQGSSDEVSQGLRGLLQQVVKQLLPKLHQATQRLRRQLLLACVLLLNPSSHDPLGLALPQEPLKVHSALCLSCPAALAGNSLSHDLSIDPEVSSKMPN